MADRIQEAKADAAESSGVARLQALQRVKDLEARKAKLEDSAVTKEELRQLEADFVAAAAEYGESKGIDYKTWREAGVPAPVLEKADIAP
ncbi:MAG: hypothetical protein U5R31_16985 [Acidimicrobiia bacterium]|nr:hypothetical protein [Acidimicrobiia bacterium]